jgi:hypothetical protein
MSKDDDTYIKELITEITDLKAEVVEWEERHSKNNAIIAELRGHNTALRMDNKDLMGRIEKAGAICVEGSSHDWYCGCGHWNGANLAVCALCGRTPGETP